MPITTHSANIPSHFPLKTSGIARFRRAHLRYPWLMKIPRARSIGLSERGREGVSDALVCGKSREESVAQ